LRHDFICNGLKKVFVRFTGIWVAKIIVSCGDINTLITALTARNVYVNAVNVKLSATAAVPIS